MTLSKLRIALATALIASATALSPVSAVTYPWTTFTSTTAGFSATYPTISILDNGGTLGVDDANHVGNYVQVVSNDNGGLIFGVLSMDISNSNKLPWLNENFNNLNHPALLDQKFNTIATMPYITGYFNQNRMLSLTQSRLSSYGGLHGLTAIDFTTEQNPGVYIKGRILFVNGHVVTIYHMYTGGNEQSAIYTDFLNSVRFN